MDKIEELILNSILSQNGLNKDELTVQGINVELNYYEMNVHEDNFLHFNDVD